MRPLAAAPVLVLLVLSGCQKGGDTTKPAPVTTAPVTAATTAAATAAPVAVAPLSGTAKKDPCSLLTKGIAEGALGLAVGPPTTTPLAGSTTCTYKPADGRSNVFILLTTYAASGKAALASATKVFPDATAVPGLGDAALVSRKGHAIGVSVGDLLFGMSLLRPDSFSVSPAVSESQLITVARTVVQSR
jgi:hypothetical protein